MFQVTIISLLSLLAYANRNAISIIKSPSLSLLSLLVDANRNTISIFFVEKEKKGRRRDQGFILQSLALPSLSSPGSVERDNY